MIYWMSEEISKAWDEECPWLVGYMCETNACHTPELVGHNVMQLEIPDCDDDCEGDTTEIQFDLGDCTNLSDSEIEGRFIHAFAKYLSEYRAQHGFTPLCEDMTALLSRMVLIRDNRKAAAA